MRGREFIARLSSAAVAWPGPRSADAWGARFIAPRWDRGLVADH